MHKSSPELKLISERKMVEMEKIFLDSEAGKTCCLYGKMSDSGPVAILGHGYLSSKESRTNTRLAEVLNADGISTISYDMYGHGESGGNPENLTITRAVQNVLAAYEFAEKEGFEKIGLSGSSFTGAVSLVAASKRNFSALSLKCPVFDSKMLWDEKYGGEGVQEWKQSGYISPFGRKWSYEAYEDAKGYDMKAITKSIRAPALVIHGDRDDTVPLSHALAIIDNLDTEKKLVVVEGAKHDFRNMEHFEKMISASRSWLISHLY
ncbi:prolyl oligopeptidase family serine peptidase [Candidatus Micrarchaeota archaeon]|nr:prolyl oligopeptidase family serine peptidase [Candidatus Micrarchaeota archaeon]